MKIKPANTLLAFFASAFQAFGMYNIHALADVTEGGVLGLCLLLEHWTGLSHALSGLLLNGLCFFIGWRTMGKEFIFYSLTAAAGFSLGYGICEQFPPVWPQIAAYPLAAAVLGALFIGIGAGLCIRAGGATTGDDALAMSISHITKVDIQWIYLVSDLSVLALSLSYIPLRKLIYSLLTVVLSGQIIGLIQKIPLTKKNSGAS